MTPNNAQLVRVQRASEIRVKPVESREEWNRCNDLMADEHATTQSSRRWLISHSEQYPNFRREHTRMAIAGDEVAGALRITTDTIRIGEARLKMGGISWLTVAARFRRKGIASLLMTDAQSFLRQHNYHVAMLFGIPNFYEKFGYSTSLLDHSVLVDTNEARRFHNSHRLRDAKPSDIPAIQKLHNLADGDTTCSILRSSGHLKNRWMRFADWRLLLDSDGRVLAYFYPRAEYGLLSVIELAVSDQSLYPAILGAAGEMALECSLPQVRFFLPPNHVFSRYLRQFRSVHETRYENNAGGMMAFVDIMETLESMIPEWEGLVQRSFVRDLRCEVTFVVDRKNVTIRTNRGAIDVAVRPSRHKVTMKAEELMHIVSGYRRVVDILETKPVRIPTDIGDFLHVIFPERSPFVWPYDRF